MGSTGCRHCASSVETNIQRNGALHYGMIALTLDDMSENLKPSETVLRSVDPVTGSQVAEFPVTTADQVAEAVGNARRAATAWAALSVDERRTELLRFKRLIHARRNEILALLTRENGKVAADAEIELTLTLHHLDWAARHAGRVLRPRGVRSGLMMLNQASRIERKPYGVVGVIGPWNYPMYTPMGSIAYALAAGNAVVFKPSEFTSAIGQWLADTFVAATGRDGLFAVVHGWGATGADLCRSGVDKLAFTGSAPTGRKVMAACAETLTPVLMELGGKDAAIVAADADVRQAAQALLWGATMNSGQSCAGVERVYVVEAVASRFLDAIAAAAGSVEAGRDYGPVTMPGQIATIARHIDSGLSDGGSALVGGRDSVRAPFVDPVVLVDVPQSSAAVREETFGPVVTVNRVPDVDAAIAAANAVEYGLGAVVFSKRDGESIAARLDVGMVSINDVISYGAVPALPFGGNGGSGFGRIHGEPGLLEFTTPKAVTRRRFRLPVEVSAHGRRRRDEWALTAISRLVGRR
ncbi:aldehyde dehydrogenase family protein [Nocardia sp. IBHARD005]|uniref:aldehyde dehydrogenase family protein n=1 Tax=Nocardia sp. IBHARD005 TaxID=3457765 RepID=UPI0040597566